MPGSEDVAKVYEAQVALPRFLEEFSAGQAEVARLSDRYLNYAYGAFAGLMMIITPLVLTLVGKDAFHWGWLVLGIVLIYVFSRQCSAVGTEISALEAKVPMGGFDGEKLILVKNVLKALAADAAPGSSTSIRVEGSALVAPSKRSKKPDTGGGLHYDDPWLTVRAKGADGNRIRLDVVTRTRCRFKRSRPRHRTTHILKIRIVAAPKSYLGIRKDLATLAGQTLALSSAGGGEKVQVRAAACKGRTMRAVGHVRSPWPGQVGQAVLVLLGALYAHMQPRMRPGLRRAIARADRAT